MQLLRVRLLKEKVGILQRETMKRHRVKKEIKLVRVMTMKKLMDYWIKV